MTTPLSQFPLPGGEDPLARLRDAVAAPQAPWWPPAPGWWVVGALAVAAGAALAAWLWRRHQRERYRRLAVAELERAYQSCWGAAGHAPAARGAGAARRYLQEANQILRRAALVAWPRERVAALTDAEWLAFLDRAAGMREFEHGAGQALGSGPYRAAPDYDPVAVHALSRRWLRGHRSRPGPVPAGEDGGVERPA